MEIRKRVATRGDPTLEVLTSTHCRQIRVMMKVIRTVGFINIREIASIPNSFRDTTNEHLVLFD
jgi:hypothetical protein